MAAQRIAENLAYINWTVLVAVALGAYGVVVLARLRTPATRGYLVFTAACAAGFGLLAWLSDSGLPTTGSGPAAIAWTALSSGSAVPIDPAWETPRRLALVAFTVIAAAYTVALARRRRAPILAAAGLAAGLVAIGAASLGWSADPAAAVPLVVQLAILSAATGGVFAAMILGHWYLVTPKLPEGPLVLVSRLLFWVVACQVILFVVWVASGTGGGGPFSALTGPWALFVWLRLLVGLGFPLIVSWAAIQTARTRSMESATGLLYIDVGAIAAGTILAAGLYFGAGLLV
ncbi:MAG: hypothetical protein IVW53_13690 [Chloroflexi bacterium]|nr:hypothetical protein [Chloroflexota bacterium]